jgi:uncharacterized protein YndB with AHSA1/START domain
MQDCIEKEITINAPVSRVWRALSDSKEFGEWFRVKWQGPFTSGAKAQGELLVSGYEGMPITITVQRIEPETLFSYTWIPYALDPNVDYSNETPTLIEFHLSPVGEGTHLRVTECGFSRVPEHRRDLAFRMNDGGWKAQTANIKKYAEEQ